MSVWASRRFADTLQLQRGHDLPSGARSVGDVPVIGSFGVTGCHDVARYPGPGVAIGRSGASIGVATYVQSEYWPLNTCLFVKDFKGNHPRWVYYLLDSLDFTIFNSGSAQPSLNRNFLDDVPVAVPEYETQRAIADVLGALDDKIAANRTLIRVGREWICAEWSRICAAREACGPVRFDEVAEINPTTKLNDSITHPYLDMKNLPQGGIVADGWEWREGRTGTRFVDGDSILGRITPCFENGKAGFVDFVGEGRVGIGSTEFIVFRPRGDVPRAAIFGIIVSEDFRAVAAQAMTGTSGRQRVQASDLRDYELAWPSAAEVESFGAITDSLLRRLGAARDENATLARVRDELLPLLMDGRITVKEAEKRVEDVV